MIPYKPQKSYFISSQVFLDNSNQYDNCNAYKNIVTINLFPEGPLSRLVRVVKNRPLSEFQGCQQQSYSNNCLLAFVSLRDPSRLMDVNDVPDLCSFLTDNGYRIDTRVTQMFNTGDIRFDNKQILFFVNY